MHSTYHKRNVNGTETLFIYICFLRLSVFFYFFGFLFFFSVVVSSCFCIDIIFGGLEEACVAFSFFSKKVLLCNWIVTKWFTGMLGKMHKFAKIQYDKGDIYARYSGSREFTVYEGFSFCTDVSIYWVVTVDPHRRLNSSLG